MRALDYGFGLIVFDFSLARLDLLMRGQSFSVGSHIPVYTAPLSCFAIEQPALLGWRLGLALLCVGVSPLRPIFFVNMDV